MNMHYAVTERTAWVEAGRPETFDFDGAEGV